MKYLEVVNGEWSCFPFEVMKGLKPNLQIVFTWLVRHRNKHTGNCYPSVKLLSKECGISRTTVMKTLGELENKGLIKILKKKGSKSSYLLATNFIEIYDQKLDHLPVKEVDYINRLKKTLTKDSYKPKTNMVP